MVFVGKGENVCVFCEKAAKSDSAQFFGTSGTVFAVKDSFPVTELHILVIPYRHIDTVFDMSGQETADAWQLVKTVRKMLLGQDSSIVGFNVGVNCGASAGQTVPHAHIHVIPRRAGDAHDPAGGVRGAVPGMRRYR